MGDLAQQLVNGLMLGCMYALIALGFSLFFGVLDVIQFSHGDVCVLGSFLVLALAALGSAYGAFNVSAGAALAALIGLAVLGTGLLGVVMERGCIKPFRRAPLIVVLLSTVALGIILREAIRLFFPQGSNPHTFPPLFPARRLHVGGATVGYDNLLVLGVTAGLFVGTHLFVTRTRLGLAMRAVAQNREVAQMMGISLNGTVGVTFFLGSAIGAVAGILNGAYYSIVKFDMGLVGGVKGFSAAVIGGLGHTSGALLGGLILGFTETIAAVAIPEGSKYQDVFSFLVVLFFLIFRPAGILTGRTEEKV